MSLLVDTSVWSLALRRDGSTSAPEVQALLDALAGSDWVVTTGLVLQELLQGFHGPRAAAAIIERFAALPIIAPDRQDHIAAAEVRNNGAASCQITMALGQSVAHVVVRKPVETVAAQTTFPGRIR